MPGKNVYKSLYARLKKVINNKKLSSRVKHYMPWIKATVKKKGRCSRWKIKGKKPIKGEKPKEETNRRIETKIIETKKIDIEKKKLIKGKKPK